MFLIISKKFNHILLVLFNKGNSGLALWWSDTPQPQLYGCSRQCGRPVWARCSMGFGPNPLINGLIQHTFKLNILFFRKIHSDTFWLDKTFSFSSQLTMMLQKKRFFENKKIRLRLSIVDFPAKPAKQKKTSSSWKIIEVTHSRRSGRGCRMGVLIFWKKKPFFKIPDLAHRPTLAPIVTKNRC